MGHCGIAELADVAWDGSGRTPGFARLHEDVSR